LRVVRNERGGGSLLPRKCHHGRKWKQPSSAPRRRPSRRATP